MVVLLLLLLFNQVFKCCHRSIVKASAETNRAQNFNLAYIATLLSTAAHLQALRVVIVSVLHFVSIFDCVQFYWKQKFSNPETSPEK